MIPGCWMEFYIKKGNATEHSEMDDLMVVRERAVAFVVARLTSSRLPAKHFRQIGGKSLLDWVVEQLQLCREIDEIVIATVAEKENKPLEEYAARENISLFCYDGNVNHVTTRLHRAAEVFNADICVLVSADCPLIHYSGIDSMISCLRQSVKADVVAVSPRDNMLTQLQGIQVARRRAWQLADDLSNAPELKEHQFPVIGRYPEKFVVKNCLLPESLYCFDCRLSVDTMADLEFQNRLFMEITHREFPFDLPHVLTVLREKPELSKINAHVYHRGLIENIKHILFIVDAGKEYGYGHLMRSLELAAQIVERLSYPITFVADDEHAVNLITMAGFRFVHGRISSSPDLGKFELQLVEQNSEQLFLNHHLIVMDISARHKIVKGWKEKLNSRLPVVVMDITEAWTREADLIFVPGVTCKENCRDLPQLKTGKELIILRRSVRRIQNTSLNKDIDVTAYLHSETQRESFRKFAENHHLTVHISEGLEMDFHEKLARSRVLLASFGYTFYEAIALNVFPVAWPSSDSHKQDALRFYQNMGLSANMINFEEDLEHVLLPLCGEHEVDIVPIELNDGTPLIVQEIQNLIT